MKLEQAIADIRLIREQLDRLETWKGFRSIAIGCSSGFVLAGFAIQQMILPAPETGTEAFLGIWIGVAICSAIVTGVEMGIRSWKADSSDVWRMQRGLLTQLIPCLFTGIVLTAVIVQRADSPVAFLPGMWGLVYGLGLVACRFHLPRGTWIVSGWFLVAPSLFLIAKASSPAVAMLAIFGVGQVLFSLVLSTRVRRFVASFSREEA